MLALQISISLLSTSVLVVWSLCGKAIPIQWGMNPEFLCSKKSEEGEEEENEELKEEKKWTNQATIYLH